MNNRSLHSSGSRGGNGDPATNAWSFTMTFPSAGTTTYVCDEHASVGMNGSIVVQ